MNYEWAMSGPWITKGETDTQYKYFQDKNTLYIAFQGSISKEDWRQNFSFWVQPYRDMPVRWFAHAGFVEKWKSVEDEILSLAEKSENICVSGFSQGGAIAVLAHESIRFHDLNKSVQTVTWGCPRVVWCWNLHRISHRFEGITRHERFWDIVTHVPPALFGYLHVGKRLTQGSRWPTLKVVENHMGYT